MNPISEMLRAILKDLQASTNDVPLNKARMSVEQAASLIEATSQAFDHEERAFWGRIYAASIESCLGDDFQEKHKVAVNDANEAVKQRRTQFSLAAPGLRDGRDQ